MTSTMHGQTLIKSLGGLCLSLRPFHRFQSRNTPLFSPHVSLAWTSPTFPPRTRSLYSLRPVVEILLEGNFRNTLGREVERSRQPLPCSTSFVTSLPIVTLAVLFVNRRSISIRPHFCMNEHWFSTLERLKKKNISRLKSVADLRVALAACFGDFVEFVKERRHLLNAFLSLNLAASISIIMNLI